MTVATISISSPERTHSSSSSSSASRAAYAQFMSQHTLRQLVAARRAHIPSPPHSVSPSPSPTAPPLPMSSRDSSSSRPHSIVIPPPPEALYFYQQQQQQQQQHLTGHGSRRGHARGSSSPMPARMSACSAAPRGGPAFHHPRYPSPHARVLDPAGRTADWAASLPIGMPPPANRPARYHDRPQQAQQVPNQHHRTQPLSGSLQQQPSPLTPRASCFPAGFHSGAMDSPRMLPTPPCS